MSGNLLSHSNSFGFEMEKDAAGCRALNRNFIVGGEDMDEDFIRNRITELRLKKGESEYQMSLALGQNRSYIQAISSGRSLPSMPQFLKICDYFEITPLQFFDTEAVNPQLIRKAMDGMRKLKDEDLIMLIGFINRLQSED